MSDSGETPLRLEDLAQVDSPEVLHAALRRFRKRALIRGGGIALIIAALFIVPRALRDDRVPTFTERLASAQTHSIGRIIQEGRFTVAVLDARYVAPLRAEPAPPAAGSSEPPPLYGPEGPESGYFLHVAITAPDIRNDETLELFDQSTEFIFGVPFPSENRPTDARRSQRVGEGFISFRKAQRTVSVTVVAFTGKDGGARGPRTHTQDQCAVPLNPVEACELLKIEGRVIGSIQIDLAQFQIPAFGG